MLVRTVSPYVTVCCPWVHRNSAEQGENRIWVLVVCRAKRMLRCPTGCSAVTIPLLPPPPIQPLTATSCWKDLQLPHLVIFSHILITFVFPMIFPAILFALDTVTSETSWIYHSQSMYCHCSSSSALRFGLGKDHPEVLLCEQWTVYGNCRSDQISLQYWCASFSVLLLVLLSHFYPHHSFSPLGFLAQTQFPWLGYSATALPTSLPPTPSSTSLSSAFLFLFLQHSVHCISLQPLHTIIILILLELIFLFKEKRLSLK